MIRWFVFGIPALLIVLITAALINTLSLSTKRKNEMSIGSLGEPITLNPIQISDSVSSQIAGLIFNGLLKYNQDLEITTDLAKSWTLSQVSSFFFSSPENAQTALKTLLAQKDQFAKWNLKNAWIDPKNPIALLIELSEPGLNTTQNIATLFAKEKLLRLSQIQIEFSEDANDAMTVLEKECPDIHIVRTWTESPNQFEVTITDEPNAAVTAFQNVIDKAFPNIKVTIQPTETLFFLAEPIVDFELRQNVHWHDGAPFTTRDVLFTYRAIMDPAMASPRKTDFSFILNLQATSDYHLRATYRKPYSPALLSWMTSILPAHILENKPISWWAENFNRRPVGTGPFKFDRWKTNEYVRVVRNPNYYQGQPWLDSIVFRVLPDPLTLRLAFETRLVDFWAVDPWAIQSFEKDSRFDLFSSPSSSYTYVGWNLRRPLFQDPTVREALACAVNIPQMIRYLLYGHGTQSTGIFLPQMWFFNPNIKPIEYNPKRAAELLAQAGWKPGPDGILRKNGQRFTFTLLAQNGNEVRRDIATLVQADLAALGIEVNVEIYEWAVFIKRFITQGQFDACVLGWALGPDFDQFPIWHSSQVNPEQLNFVGYKNPVADRLLEQLRQEYNRDRIIKMAGELQQIIYTDQPYLFLFVPEATSVMWANAFRIRRPDGHGGWIDSPVEMTKAGWNYYLEWFYRTEFAPAANPSAPSASIATPAAN